MIKAVIADDEIKICKLIQALGDWDRLGISVAGTASNGIEALDLVNQEHPDILITDIRMPGCDGIQLIEKVSSSSPETHIVIVSGYAEFSYAQAAVRHGVEDYLLKPINKEQLNECLTKIRDKIVHEQEAEEELETTLKRAETNTEALRASFLSDCLIDPGRKFTEDELQEHYQISVSGGTYQFLCAKTDGAPDNENQKFIWERMISELTKEMKGICREQVYLVQNSYLYGFLAYSSREQEPVRKALKSSLNRVLSLRGVFGDTKVTLATGYYVRDISQLGDAFLSAREMIKERLAMGTGKVLEWKNPGKALFEKRLLEGYNRDVSSALEFWSEDAIVDANETLCGEITGTKEADGREIYDTIIGAGTIFMTQLHLPDQSRQIEVYNEKCSNCPTKAQLMDVFCLFTMDLMHSVAQWRENDDDRTVRMAKQYIQNHYSEQITLEEVSSHLGLTQAYFSTFFKKKTGIGFAKYLMTVRVDAAKVLLKEGNYSVAEICTMVGYNDQRNFNRVFQQVTGVKPAVYRKLYG